MMRKTKILIVDDEPQILRALRAGLTAQGYEVIGASDGEEALDKASAELPDAVILDFNLPRKSGLDVCRELRASFAVPIIVLSVRDAERDKVTALDLGPMITSPSRSAPTRCWRASGWPCATPHTKTQANQLFARRGHDRSRAAPRLTRRGGSAPDGDRI